MSEQRFRECLDEQIAHAFDELDRASSIAVQRHLEHCSACAREAEIERTVGNRLAQALAPAEEPPEVDGANMERPLVRGRTPRSKRMALFGLVALLLGAHLEVASSNPERVASWIERTRGWSVHVPVPRHGTGKLIGARRCSVGGRDAILLLYELRGALASLVVLPSERLKLNGMRPGKTRGRFVDRCRGHPVVAQRRGDLTYIATGPCPRDRLLGLLPRPTTRSAALSAPSSKENPRPQPWSHEWNRSAS